MPRRRALLAAPLALPFLRRAAAATPIRLFVGDVRPLLSAADVFILPTVYDPFSNACLEALAAGLPVITTAANGCAEVLREGISGSVVPRANDVQALANALRYWSIGQRASGAAGECRALLAECSLEQNVTRTLEILEALRRN